jgi:Holliday junction DNA helicase RuvA
MIVREDAQSLYGFLDVEELALFQALLKVTGVGPKSALAVLGTMGVEALQSAVMQENDEAFKSVPGVGPKTAKLICVQLAGRFKGTVSATGLKKQVELLDALTGLGYSQKVASEAIKAANVGDLPIAEALRITLAALSRKASE